jgi:GNAT superfamily N-acetyltransferase
MFHPAIAMRKKADDGLTIERVTGENFKQLLRLIEGLAKFEKLAPPDNAAKRRLRRDTLSKNPRCEAYLCRLGSKYVAYVIVYFTYSSFRALPTLYLEDIFVLEEYRRRGIGQAMFDFCVKRAKKEGCGRIEFTVLDWNKSAQRFYEKNDAEKTEWDFYRLNLK